MNSMSAQDAAFLHLEDATNPMHLGSVAVFEGPAPRYGDLVRHVARRITRVPRYRQSVRFVPLGLGTPTWADDPHFQILYHVRHAAVPKPGGPEQLRNLAGRVFAQNLDRSKPLWELWLVEGLPAEQWALISKIHHSMVDGVSSVDMLAVLMDTRSDPDPVPDTVWQPAPAPSPVQLVALAVANGLSRPASLLQAFAGGSGSAVRDLRTTVAAWQAMLDTVVRGQRTVSSLNGSIGPNRRWSWVTSSLGEVKLIRRTLGGTVNDVILAAITRGFRDLLLRRGEDLEDRVVRTLVPVSVRTADERGELNNRVAGFLPELPVGEADPLVRLQDIREQMDEMKGRQHAQAGDALTQLSGFVPPPLFEMAVRAARGLPQRAVNTVTTNVPGPQQPLYMAGCRLLEAHPYVPIGGNMQFGIAIFSYMGKLHFGITADYDGGADIEVLCRGIEEGIAELLERAAEPVGANGHPAPPEPKAPAANGRRKRRPTPEPAGRRTG